MKRKEFLRLGAIVATLGPLSTTFSSGRSGMNILSLLENSEKDIAKISATVQNEFTALMKWLAENGWTKFLKDTTGVNLSLNGEALNAELLRDFDATTLKKLTTPESGFDDFAGMNLIKPGFPAFSLLYHALASPRVRSTSILAYPDLAQLDVLENYIYALAEWEHLKSIYNVKSNDELVMAVF